MVSGKLDSEAYGVEIKAQVVEIKNVRDQGEPENGICSVFLGIRIVFLVSYYVCQLHI